MVSRLGFACSLWLGLFASGCSESSSDPNASGSGGGGASGAGGVAGSGGAAGAAPCSEPPSEIPPGASCLLEVKGRNVDAAGAPIAKLSTSVCGPVCFYGESDATGAFTVPVGVHLLPKQYATQPHGRPTRTSFYFALPPNPGPSVDLGDLLSLDLPPSGPPLVVRSDKAGSPAQTATSGDLTLDVPTGVQVKLDVEDIALGDTGRMFRALRVPAGNHAAFVDASLGLSLLWALTPFDATIVDEAQAQPALARLSAENAAALPAGAAVEWLALGSYLLSDLSTPAVFDVVATGTVTADGMRIEMDPGQGVRYLTWLGVRKKP